MPKAQKPVMMKGLEVLLNDQRVSPLNNPAGFKAMLDASQLPMSEVLKHVGSKKKAPKVKEEQRSEARIARLESESKSD